MKWYPKRPWYWPILKLRSILEICGSCLSCGDSWYWKSPHIFKDSVRGVMFPCCEECWSKMDITRKKFYVEMLVMRMGTNPGENEYSSSNTDHDDVPCQTVISGAVKEIARETVNP